MVSQGTSIFFSMFKRLLTENLQTTLAIPSCSGVTLIRGAKEEPRQRILQIADAFDDDERVFSRYYLGSTILATGAPGFCV